MSMGYGEYYEHYAPSRPRKARNGIRTLSRKGDVGSNWWSKRWLAVLDRFGWESRLERGRSYARKGQVISINIMPGIVNAKVQGSRRRPYSVSILMPRLSEGEWERIISLMGRQVAFAERLLGGEVPEEMEAVFKEAGASIFPDSPREIQTKCSCPDVANPCKHIAAVCYVLAERFDVDPFNMFYIRGISRKELVEALSPKANEAIEAPARIAGRRRAAPVMPAASFWKAKRQVRKGGILQAENGPAPLGIMRLPENAVSEEALARIESYYGEIARKARKMLVEIEEA